LQFLAAHPIDVILLDLMMPDMDGFAVMRELKKDPLTAEIPVIMVTARDDLNARSEGMRLGVADFLAKPVFRKQLGNRIRAQLDMVATGHATAVTLDRLEANQAKR
jgi:DNA-binding response OmpR family regulator